MSVASFIQSWKALSRFIKLSEEARSIVFYAEDAGSWRYFASIIDELAGNLGKQICYVTSSPTDPILKRDDPRIQAFCVGFGIPLTKFFKFLQARVMVMTMPDLNTYHIKRSKYPVHYVYIFHTMVSSHMIFRRGAFDHFDAIMCVGPHHQEEIRAAEKLYGLEPKTLVDAGYGNLDAILNAQNATLVEVSPNDGVGKRVLIAPTWGDNGLIETCGRELVEVLLQAGHRVTVRPHSMTIRHSGKLLAELGRHFDANPEFKLDLDLTSQGTVQASDIMISDWSGAALEYAFGLERPVLFVDVPPKVNNPEYKEIPCVPIEVTLRSEIGEVVSPDRLADVPASVDRLCRNPEVWQDRIREARSRWVYNIGTSGRVVAAYITEVAETAKFASGAEHTPVIEPMSG